MKQLVKHYAIAIVGLGILGVIGTAVFVYSGAYNIGADEPHSKPVYRILQTLREHSIQSRSKDIVVPNLNDPELILKGAGQYAAMCTSCHLTPATKDSELRAGMYPQPPNLTQGQRDPRAEFWVIKHGIKMSAMPAWGGSHDDATIWSMVAFVQKLPGMTPEQYKEIVAKAPPDDDMDEGKGDTAHDHDEHAADNDMKGMKM